MVICAQSTKSASLVQDEIHSTKKEKQTQAIHEWSDKGVQLHNNDTAMHHIQNTLRQHDDI